MEVVIWRVRGNARTAWKGDFGRWRFGHAVRGAENDGDGIFSAGWGAAEYDVHRVKGAGLS